MSERFDLTLEQLRAAGEPTRLRILALLRERDLSVGEIVQILSLSQPRLSHHLKALTGAPLSFTEPQAAAMGGHSWTPCLNSLETRCPSC